MVRLNLPHNVNVLDYSFYKKYDLKSNLQSIRPGKPVRDHTVTDISQLKNLHHRKVLYTIDYFKNCFEFTKEQHIGFNNTIALFENSTNHFR